LKWTIVTKEVSQQFIAERSINAQTDSWKTIGTIAATAEMEYTITDNHTSPGMNYYRLRSNCANGPYTVSNIKTINFEDHPGSIVNAFPNPVKNSLTLTGIAAGSNILMLDMAGNPLGMLMAGKNNTEFINTAAWAPGYYFLKITALNGAETFIKFIRE
jgi:hypothetical protein